MILTLQQELDGCAKKTNSCFGETENCSRKLPENSGEHSEESTGVFDYPAEQNSCIWPKTPLLGAQKNISQNIWYYSFCLAAEFTTLLTLWVNHYCCVLGNGANAKQKWIQSESDSFRVRVRARYTRVSDTVSTKQHVCVGVMRKMCAFSWWPLVASWVLFLRASLEQIASTAFARTSHHKTHVAMCTTMEHRHLR